jgi:dienelactone hydrolase
MTPYALLPLAVVMLSGAAAPMRDTPPSAQAWPAPEAFVAAPCETGIYRKDAATFVAVTKAERGFAYAFSDGVNGYTEGTAALLACGKGAVLVRAAEAWPKEAIAETNTRFSAAGALLAGRLMVPPGAGKHTPLVVYAHGSEGSGWIDRARDPYQMVGRGVAVFVYDKRGTGLSEGELSQNLPQLADDLVAASVEAQRLAHGRFGRFGLVGLSQGGWTVPLAATRAHAQFIGIGYGLAVDIAEQDGEQVAKELRDRGYDDDVLAQARTVTDITATIAKSGATQGLAALAEVQARYGKERWFALMKGGYTGVLAAMPAEVLRTQGVPAAFVKLNVDWRQDPVQVLTTLAMPQLWALAGEDRQAPVGQTLARLAALRAQGQPIAVYVFPHADHGMAEYEEAKDFTRKRTRIAPGFYDLMADWAKGELGAAYGAARRE